MLDMIKPAYSNPHNKKKSITNNNNNYQSRNRRNLTFTSNGTTNNTNHHQHQSYQQNQQNQQNYIPKIQHPSITNILDYQTSVVYGSLDYTLPTASPEPLHTSSQPIINSLPKFAQRPSALLVNTKLHSTYLESLSNSKNPQRSSTDLNDPSVQIVMSNKSKAKIFKLGDIEIDIYSSSSKKPKKFVNKLLTKDSFVSTPLKRTRDELIDVSSSLKKNKRMFELQQQETSMIDSPMELSFEGKAMDRSDIVKLVDSSVILPDDSHLQDLNPSSNGFFDTKNLLQNTEFNFEYKL